MPTITIKLAEDWLRRASQALHDMSNDAEHDVFLEIFEAVFASYKHAFQEGGDA